MLNAANTSKIGLFSLVMLITGALDSVRNLPTTALFGSSLLFFFILATLMFLIPTALVSAQLSCTKTTKPGIYGWVKDAFGEKFALIAIWLQWVNTVVWYPTILSFIAGTVTYLINPSLAQNKFYLVSVILIVFWGLTFISNAGIKTSARFASVCAVIGMIIPMIFIISLGGIWLAGDNPNHLPLSANTFIPDFQKFDNWISLTAIITAFLGIELATVHVKDVQNPQKNFPKAVFISSVLIIITMLLGALAIAVVLPKEQINLVDGLMQAFSNFFAVYHLTWFTPIIAIMIIIGSLGQMTNWVISPAKGLLQAAEDGYLPAFLQKQNKHGAPTAILFFQAFLVSLCCIAFLYIPSINGSYWLLTALSTQLYVILYVLMFMAALKLRYTHHHLQQGFTIPGGKNSLWAVCILGIVGCLTALIVGFFPPESIQYAAPGQFETLFTSGIFLLILPALLMITFKPKQPLSAF